MLPDTGEWYGISIVACSTSDTNRITIADGWGPHDHGMLQSVDSAVNDRSTWVDPVLQ